MRANYTKIEELAESYLNGNKSYVRDKVKRLNKLEFVLLCADLDSSLIHKDIDQIAHDLTYAR